MSTDDEGPFTGETHTATVGRSNVLRVRAADVDVRSGPDAGRKARVVSPTFVIGKGEGCDLRLSDGRVSREHVRLALVTDGIRVRDTGSKNGTWVGAARIADAVFGADFKLDIGESSLSVRIEPETLDLALSPGFTFGGAIGVSSIMRHLFALLEDAARSEITVLLEGESGVGKEVLARAIHQKSPRAAGPFITVDCGAIPATLIESELFGHERGAFTGADRTRRGLFDEADGGTIFLDEIGELPVDMQPKLLRALEAQEVRPIGARAAHRVNVRVVAATNRRLAEASQRGEFRQDLYYRIAVARVTVPPLRDRPEDIAPLAASFLRAVTGNASARLSTELSALLSSYAWPGNVRELRNVIDRYAALGMMDDVGGLLDRDVEKKGDETFANLPYHEARRIVLERLDRAYIPAVIERAGGVIARAAEQAEVARPTFYRMLERLRLREPPEE